MKEGKLLDRLAKLAKTGAEAEDIILTLKLDKKFKTGTNGLAWHNLVDTVEKLMKEEKKKKKLKSTYEVGKKPDKELEIEDRNYRKEYDNYHAKPDQRERNAGRLRARRLMAKLGKVSKGDKMDVHHKDNDPTNNEKGNLSVTTQKYNRTEPRLREDDTVFHSAGGTSAIQPDITPDSQFAGVDVFNVNDNDFNNCKFGKRKHKRWSNYVDVESESGKRIYGYAKKNPSKSIIVQHNRTGHMLYLRKYAKMDGTKSGIMVKKGTKQ